MAKKQSRSPLYHLVIGLVICAAGTYATIESCGKASGGGTYTIWWGAIMLGALEALYGLFGLIARGLRGGVGEVQGPEAEAAAREAPQIPPTARPLQTPPLAEAVPVTFAPQSPVTKRLTLGAMLIVFFCCAVAYVITATAGTFG